MNTNKLSFGTLFGEFTGMLKGFLHHDLPDNIRKNVNDKIAELESIKQEQILEKDYPGQFQQQQNKDLAGMWVKVNSIKDFPKTDSIQKELVVKINGSKTVCFYSGITKSFYFNAGFLPIEYDCKIDARNLETLEVEYLDESQPPPQPFETFMQDFEKENIELHDKIHDGVDIEAMAYEYAHNLHCKYTPESELAERAYIKGANDYKALK